MSPVVDDKKEDKTTQEEPAATTRAPKATPAYEAKPSKNSELWWSSKYRNHTIAVSAELGNSVRFDGYSLEVDLDDPIGKRISEELHRCGQEGLSIFVVGSEYPDNEVGTKKQVEFMRTLREAAEDEYGDGIERIRALFTRRELVKAGLHPATEDVDALIMLALKTKSLKGEL